MADEKKESNLISLGGLWIQESKDKKLTYLSGKLSDRVRILVFKNEKKSKDTDPDYFMNLAPVEKKEEPPKGGGIGF